MFNGRGFHGFVLATFLTFKMIKKSLDDIRVGITPGTDCSRIRSLPNPAPVMRNINNEGVA